MPTRFDPVLITATLNGTDVSASIESATIHLGFTRRFSEAEVTFISTPARWSAWDPLVISCGINAGDMSGSVTRFNGYALDPSITHWPYTPKLIGQGPLAIADRTVVTADPYATAIITPNTQPVWYDVNTGTGYVDGIDLTLADPNGKTDSAMITWILDQCGLSGRIAQASDIGGLPYLLGTYALDQFVWRVNQSGLQAIEEIDKVYSFRTYETLGGDIVRQRTTPFAPFAPVFTFDEGTHLLEGATVTREVQNIKNRVVVTGYDDGSGPTAYVATGGVTILPPGSTWQSETFQSGLIELDTLGEKDSNGNLLAGLSCQEVAEDRLGQLQYPMLRATIPTHWDYAFAPGQVVYLNAPHLLGVNQAMWVEEVEIRVTPDSFTQTLTLYAADYGSTGSAPNTAPAARPSLAITLPARLKVAP